ncbi:MAG: hypothetical protein AAFQ89_05590 [Cyanobacteria bacterium J06626_18]
MLRQDLKSAIPPEESTAIPTTQPAMPQAARASESIHRLDIQQSLDVLEELILESPRVPLSRRTLVDEDKLLEQLDRIRLNLPSVFQEAMQIVQQRDRILGGAEQQAQEMLNAVENEATRRLQEMGIVQRAEEQARQVQQKLQQDCDALRSQTMAEIEQWQEAARQHWEATKQQSEAECVALKQEADVYAAQVLQRVEQQLAEMLQVVYNGRKALAGESNAPADMGRPSSPTSPSRARALPQSGITRPGRSQRRVE